MSAWEKNMEEKVEALEEKLEATDGDAQYRINQITELKENNRLEHQNIVKIITETVENIMTIESVMKELMIIIERGWKGECNIWSDMEALKKKLSSEEKEFDVVEVEMPKRLRTNDLEKPPEPEKIILRTPEQTRAFMEAESDFDN